MSTPLLSTTVIRRVSIVLTLAIVALVGYTLMKPDDGPRHLTATFERTTSLYAGARVKVLGVNVGKVDSITVKGTAVEVKISYDSDVDLPDDVHALIVPPSIVGDRFVQLAPAYEGGARLSDGARLGLDRTGVPLELDDTYRSLDQLATSLGPDGANKDGALSRFVDAAASNLDGNGRQFNDTIRQLSGAISVLAGSSDDINGTVANLADLSQTFAGKDAEVRRLVESLSRVGTELDRQRSDLSGAVKELRTALTVVADFTAENRGALKETVGSLESVSGNLASHADELGRLTSLAPVGLTSLLNIFVPKNFDLAHPERTPIDGRAGNQALRAPLFEDLEVQLSSTLSAVCQQGNPTQQAQLAAFCGALGSAGGSIGALLTTLLAKGGPSLPTDPSARTLSAMMGAAR
ncbi:phospholipid/cholesterol/gamma-HCH transport system substrate-binding protein [Marmoricola sp. OAE513]|uniref:MCE family protein n=1 Tax=Marmoricola sp. OAE513 TaxID=2817894 RepID=UPI001AE24358